MCVCVCVCCTMRVNKSKFIPTFQQKHDESTKSQPGLGGEPLSATESGQHTKGEFQCLTSKL